MAAHFSLQIPERAVDTTIVDSQSGSGFVPIMLAALVGAAIGALGFLLGLGGLRSAWLLAFLLGGAGLAVGAYLIQVAARRRARLEAIADLLPRYRDRRLDDEALLDECGLNMDTESATHGSGARAEIRAATRALLVSLEEEIRREKRARSARPGCRRARLRAAGRTAPRRRRPPVRMASMPS